MPRPTAASIEVRDLCEKVKPIRRQSWPATRSYIIDEVHSLSTSAASFNALLKTLEEPPEHAVFILATTDPQKLPAYHSLPLPAL